VINSLPEGLDTGVYYGWASLDGNEVYKMVLSVGWNPFFKNTKKSMVGEGIDHQTTCFLDCLWLKYETIGR
jgi:riboflavin kinase